MGLEDTAIEHPPPESLVGVGSMQLLLSGSQMRPGVQSSVAPQLAMHAPPLHTYGSHDTMMPSAFTTALPLAEHSSVGVTHLPPRHTKPGRQSSFDPQPSLHALVTS